jgi:hypothetical protein
MVRRANPTQSADQHDVIEPELWHAAVRCACGQRDIGERYNQLKSPTRPLGNYSRSGAAEAINRCRCCGVAAGGCSSVWSSSCQPRQQVCSDACSCHSLWSALAVWSETYNHGHRASRPASKVTVGCTGQQMARTDTPPFSSLDRVCLDPEKKNICNATKSGR